MVSFTQEESDIHDDVVGLVWLSCQQDFPMHLSLTGNYVRALLTGCLSPSVSERTIVGTNLIK